MKIQYNLPSNISLSEFSSTLKDFSNYIIEHNNIPTFIQYNVNMTNITPNQAYYYNLHLYNILNPLKNPIPELYKLYLHKIKISNYKTPPNYEFTPH